MAGYDSLSKGKEMIMSLNPTGLGVNHNWNYSKQDRDGFSLELYGTIVSLQEVQARVYTMNGQPGRPDFWPDGNPKWNIRVGFATPDGSLKSLTFQKAGKKQISGEKPSVHMQLFNLTNGNMMDLIGKTVHMWTWPANPNTGQAWGQGNPRLFGVEEVPDVKYELAQPLPEEFTVPELLANDGASGGQPTPPQPQQVVVPQQVQYQQPANTYQPQYQQAYMTAPQPVQQPQVMMQQPVIQQQPVPQQQATTAQMPQGMDPVVAQAMQAVGAQNVQPIDPYANDADVPF